MATLMDLIMREYGSVPSAPTASPMDMRRTFLPTFPQATAPMMPPSGPSNPMAALGTPAQQRSDFERMVGISAPPQPNPLANPALNVPVVAGLDTTNRPAPMASSVTAPAREQGFFEKLFKGPQYQSNNMLLQAEGQPINWGQAMTPQLMPDKKISMTPSYIPSDSAADFFRADALLQKQNPAMFGLLGGNNG